VAVWQGSSVPLTRLLDAADATAVASLLQENRSYLAPWQPLRPDRYYTEAGQREAVEKALEQHASGSSVPLVIEDGSGVVVGTLTLQSIIRGAFQSCSVGYWLSEAAQGNGLATRALSEAVGLAFGDLRLHRIQAETLPHNRRSQRVLERVGFVQYGAAASYLHIAGEWQDHLLYQLVTPTPERVDVA
jgi:[ribosomal protein S5]-alanine N-acetyltransferase